MDYKEGLRELMADRGMCEYDLAKALGVSRQSVNSTLSDRCGMTVETFLRWLEVLNGRMVIEWDFGEVTVGWVVA